MPDCDECCKYYYDLKTGERSYQLDKPIRRPGSSPPPCSQCEKCKGEEKKRPATGKRNQLSPKNHQMLRGYFEHKGSGGEVRDRLQRRYFGVIEEIFKMNEIANYQQIGAFLTAMPGMMRM